MRVVLVIKINQGGLWIVRRLTSCADGTRGDRRVAGKCRQRRTIHARSTPRNSHTIINPENDHITLGGGSRLRERTMICKGFMPTRAMLRRRACGRRSAPP